MKVKALALSFMCFITAPNTSMNSFFQPSGYFVRFKPLSILKSFVHLWNLPRSTKLAAGGIGGLIAAGYFLSKKKFDTFLSYDNRISEQTSRA
jgi:hypothetical protein